MKLTASTYPLPTTRDQKVNLSYIKRLECEFLCCCKLMLRLHRVVVCKLTCRIYLGREYRVLLSDFTRRMER